MVGVVICARNHGSQWWLNTAMSGAPYARKEGYKEHLVQEATEIQ
jgi:hypothetical protein